MLRIIILLIASIFLVSCVAEKNDNQKVITLSSGKKVEVEFEKKYLEKNYPVLLVECTTEEKIIKDDEAEKDILEIWSEMEKIADREELDEANIKFKFPTEDVNEKGETEKVYIVTIFSAEKMENGKWKIDKIG